MKKTKMINLNIYPISDENQNSLIGYYTLKYKNHSKSCAFSIATTYEDILKDAEKNADEFACTIITKEYGDVMDIELFSCYYDEIFAEIEFDNTPVELSDPTLYIPLTFTSETSKENGDGLKYAELLFNRDYIGGRCLIRLDAIKDWSSFQDFVIAESREFANSKAFYKFFFTYGPENADYDEFVYGGSIIINEDLKEEFNAMVSNLLSMAIVG